ncbi:MAG: hypothetical protein ABI249_00365 [Ornithinibacter sp.]
MAPDRRSTSGHGLVLVRRSPVAVTRWLRKGMVSSTVAPLGVWTGVTLSREQAHSASPYDVGLELLAARPIPRRAKPAIGFFELHGRAAITVQPAGIRRGHHWLVWEPRRGVVRTPDLSALALPMLLDAAGAGGRVRAEAVGEVLSSGQGSPLDLLVTVLGLLGLPGKDLLLRRDCAGATDVEPNQRAVLAFDRLMADEAAHVVEMSLEDPADRRGGRAQGRSS